MSAQDSYFIFNGIDTRKYGLYVTGTSVYAAPAYSYDVQSVDGRDGDIIYSHGRHDNLTISYTVQAKGSGEFGFRSKFETFRRKLSACEGYCQLTDGYNPDYVRYGYFSTTQYATAKGQAWNGGEMTITFSCKPLMYLAAGMDYMEYPMLVRGRCGTSGLRDGIDVSRVGYFATADHTTMYFRAVNVTDDIEITVTQVANATNTWTSCTQETVKLPESGAWVAVDVVDNYLWFELSRMALFVTKGQYLECVFDDTDDEPWRYSGYGIIILNDTDFTAKPQFNFIAMDGYKLTSNMSLAHMDGDTEVFDKLWIADHSTQNNVNFYFDSDTQTVVGENGKSMAKYVMMSEDDDGNIFSQHFPLLYPGLNQLLTYMVDDKAHWTHDRCAPYVIQFKTNIWTV